MPKSLSVDVLASVQNTVTAPRILVELGWSTTIRLSSRETLTWNSEQWVSGSLLSAKVSGAGIEASATIDLDNKGNTFGSLALLEGLKDLSVNIWALYGESPFVTDDAVKIFSGTMNGGTIDEDSVNISCDSNYYLTMYSPRIYSQPPLCNHNVPAGTTLSWGGETYVVDRR